MLSWHRNRLKLLSPVLKKWRSAEFCPVVSDECVRCSYSIRPVCDDFRCKCVCPPSGEGNHTTERTVFIGSFDEPSSCTCENVVKPIPPDIPNYCDRWASTKCSVYFNRFFHTCTCNMLSKMGLFFSVICPRLLIKTIQKALLERSLKSSTEKNSNLP